MFSLFAPTITEAALIGSFSQWKEIKMDRQSDGHFTCSPSIPDSKYEYKYRIRRHQGEEWIDVNDPYVTIFDSQENNGLCWIKDGKKLLNDSSDFQWKYDQVKVPDNKDTIIYELYVADFSHNGQFSGVTDQLDYLCQELGVNAISMMPIIETQGFDHDWGYIGRNFFAIKASYGPSGDLKQLVDECHKRGMRVFMDGVFNHSSEECPLAIIDRNYWYYEGKHHPDDPNYWGPEFNYEYRDDQLGISPATEYVKDVVRYWVGEFHLDGIRFDAAKQMDNFNILHELDQAARSIVRPNQPFYTSAEYVPENLYITKAKNGPLDACWTQALYGNLEKALTDQVDLNGVKYAIANDNVVNYIDCHDNRRLLFRLGKNHSIFDDEAFLRMHLAAILLVTSIGVPLIWQGDELGDASSFHEDDEKKTTNRYDMHWEYLNQERNRRLFNTFKQLFELRRTNPSLRYGNIEFFHEDPDNHILAFSRNKDIFIICHFSSQIVSNYTIRNIPQSGNWIDWLTKEQFNVNQEKNLTLELSPFDARIFLQKSLDNLLDRQ